MFRKPAALTFMSASIVLLHAGDANAFQIGTAFTEPCHEHMSVSPLSCIEGGLWGPGKTGCTGSPIFPPVDMGADHVTAAIADMFADMMGVTVESDRDRLILLSLVAGCRYPDILGQSAYDLATMRPNLLSDDHEHRHFIRRSNDDGPTGDASAVQAATAFIRSEIAAALAASSLPEDQRMATHTVAIDFYGEVEVTLYEPLFRLGVALHAFEDSFAHTVRSGDLVTIVAVLNSIEALSGTLVESRDGIAHSMAMDRCMEQAAPVAEVAAVAVAELVSAVAIQASGRSGSAVGEVLERWLHLQPGCNETNDWCNSPWIELVRQEPFMPILDMAGGCGASGGSAAGLLLLLPVAVLSRIRRRR